MQARLSVASTDIDPLVAVPGVALVVCGIGYALVLFTPFGGPMLPGVDGAAAVLGLAAAAGLGLIGPGAFSIDARLFGRREIFIHSRQRPF
jgi:membrane associated rhomboid family serine protease